MELIAGILVALAALALVLEPLVRTAAPVFTSSDHTLDDLDFTDIEESESPKVQALLALKEIEFDRATGKLSETDYAALKARYAGQAMAAIKAEEQISAGADAGDAAEAAIQRARAGARSVCPTCGPRPETGATFCSSCGRTLTATPSHGRCSSCGEPIPPGAKFCANCGVVIAA